MRKTKFKVELEIEVEYNMADDAVAITPYTSIRASLDKYNKVNLEPSVGKITGFNPIKMTRLEN